MVMNYSLLSWGPSSEFSQNLIGPVQDYGKDSKFLLDRPGAIGGGWERDVREKKKRIEYELIG